MMKTCVVVILADVIEQNSASCVVPCMLQAVGAMGSGRRGTFFLSWQMLHIMVYIRIYFLYVGLNQPLLGLGYRIAIENKD